MQEVTIRDSRGIYPSNYSRRTGVQMKSVTAMVRSLPLLQLLQSADVRAEETKMMLKYLRMIIAKQEEKNGDDE